MRPGKVRRGEVREGKFRLRILDRVKARLKVISEDERRLGGVRNKDGKRIE